MRNSRERHIYDLESAQLHIWDERREILRFSTGNHLLIYVDRGEIRARLEETQWQGHAGQFLYIAQGKPGTIEAAGCSGACYIFHIQSLLIRSKQGRWTAEAAPDLGCIDEEGPLSVLAGERIREQAAAVVAGEREDRDWEFQKLMRLLYVERRDDAPRKTGRPGGIGQSVEYINNHYHEKISRETLAHLAGLAPNSFWRSFKQEMGMSPNAYLQKIRVEHAKTRLMEGMSIRETAEASGFGNEFYLSRVFKKWTGLAPSLYVKRHALKVAVASRFLYQDHLRSLGLEPVVAVDCYRHPLMDEKEYELRLFRQTAELRSASPDVIIGDFSHGTHLAWMKTIAPTVIIPHSLEWRAPFLHLADLVGRKQEAERIIVQVEQEIARYAARIASRTEDRTLSMLQVMSDHIIVQGTVNHPLNELIYRELGLQPDRATPVKEMRKYVQLQDLPSFQSRYICLRLYQEHPQVLDMWSRLRQLACWPELPAVRGGNVHLTGNWLVDSWTPQGRLRIAEEIAGIVAPEEDRK